MPGKSNLAIAQPAQTPNTRLAGTAIAAASSVSRSAASASGSRDRRRDTASSPCANASTNTVDERHDEEQRQEQQRDRGERPADQRRLGQLAPRSGVPRARISDPRQPASRRALQPWSALIASSSTNEMQQHHERDRRRARVVELLELRDDEQRRDLGPHRHVAGDEDDRAVLADRARERQREAGQPRRIEIRQDDAASAPATRLAPRLVAASSTSASRSSMTGCSVRTTNGRPMKISAMVTPSGVNATLMPYGSSGAPSQPFGA